MPWKKEYAENRKKKAESNPEYKAKRNRQATPRDPEARKAYMREYYRENRHKRKRRTPEQQAQYNASRRARYATDAGVREAKRAEVKAWQEANPEKRKGQRLKRFGIAVADFKEMLAMQNGRCAICGHDDASNPKFFPVVDHCHETGRIRGLLCINCNQALGKFKDDIHRLFSAVAYLERNGSSGVSLIQSKTR